MNSTSSGDGYNDDRTVDVEPVEESEHHRFRLRRRDAGELITDAQHTPEQNIQSRERAYMILQSLRVPFIFLAIFCAWYWENWWAAGILIVISVPIPWIAVMIGNGQGEKRDPRERNVYKPASARQAAYEAELSAHRRQELTEHSADDSITIIDNDEQ